jgi:hypothetical protein
VIGHQQRETAMPNQFFMIMSDRGKDCVASAFMAELIFSSRHAIDGDEKPASFGDPLRGVVREFLAHGKYHAGMLTEAADETRAER